MVDGLTLDALQEITGVPLQLVLRVLEASASCAPIPQAAVDVWQCDAPGIYSGYELCENVPRERYACALAALMAASAAADTLIENVRGVTLNAQGEIGRAHV